MEVRIWKGFLKAVGFVVFGWGIVGSISGLTENMKLVGALLLAGGAALIGLSELCVKEGDE